MTPLPRRNAAELSGSLRTGRRDGERESDVDTATQSGGSPADAAFHVEAGQQGHLTTLRLIGTLNMYTAPVLGARLDDALKHGCWHVVLTLAKVEHMDPEDGVGTLLRALRRVQAGHGQLLLAEVSDAVRRAIRVRGLGLVLPTFPSEEAAVEFLKSGLRTP